MRKLFLKVLVLTALVLGGLSFAPAANAVPINPPQVVGYEHHGHNPANEIYRSDVNGNCLNGSKIRFYPSASVALRISGILLWVPSGNIYCNKMSVTNGTMSTWGDCINRNHTGYDFGEGYNDNVWIITLERDPNCPNWVS